MSPILLRPIREQLEHDRIIRQLQVRWRRRFEVAINVGNEEVVSVRSGDRTCHPDLVLTNTAGGRRLHGVVEVETAESVNHLEAMAEWSPFARVRGAFYLYVPAGFTDIALRLCEDAKINVTEIWAYYAIGSQAKFSMSYRSPTARRASRSANSAAAAGRTTKKKAAGGAKAAKKAKKKKKKVKTVKRVKTASKPTTRARSTALGTATRARNRKKKTTIRRKT